MGSLDWIIFKNTVVTHARALIGTAVFIICGITFTLVGALEEEIFLAIGLPILSIGLIAVILLIISIRVAFTQPQNSHVFTWWLHFISGFTGAFMFSVPSMFALPFILIIGDDNIIVGILFTVLGVILTTVFSIIAIRMYIRRPRPQNKI